jgi:hypothetical protein
VAGETEVAFQLIGTRPISNVETRMERDAIPRLSDNPKSTLLHSQRSYNSGTTLKVSLETIVALNPTIMDCIVASHQQPREARSPVVQVSTSQRANAPLDLI